VSPLNFTFGPKRPVEHTLMPRRSFPEADSRGIMQKNPERMSLLRAKWTLNRLRASFLDGYLRVSGAQS
jgi:hypothetical protein